MRDDPDLAKLLGYDNPRYEDYLYSGLSGRVMRTSHRLLEKGLPAGRAFPRVLEIGGGAGFHFRYVAHPFDRYDLTDLDAKALERARARIDDPRLRIRPMDAGTPFAEADGACDRLIASHVLEHLPDPHAALREWHRLVAPGGVLSIALPCDPGLLWRMGQRYNVFRKRRSERKELRYAMAREHINAIGRTVDLIRYYFPNLRERWWPARVPSTDLNLLYVAQITKDGPAADGAERRA